jgi:RND superfamily putative drug exporter
MAVAEPGPRLAGQEQAEVYPHAVNAAGVTALMPTQTSGGFALITAVPKQIRPRRTPAVGRTIDRLRAELPPGSLIGGAVAENHDVQAALSAKTPLVIGVILALGFQLLLIALQAPLLTAVAC